jgi:hypothetical protein
MPFAAFAMNERTILVMLKSLRSDVLEKATTAATKGAFVMTLFAFDATDMLIDVLLGMLLAHYFQYTNKWWRPKESNL